MVELPKSMAVSRLWAALLQQFGIRIDSACERHPGHRTSRASAGGEVDQSRPLTCPRGSSVIDSQKGFLSNRYRKAVVTKSH